MHALVAFLIFALVVLVIAYVILYVLRMIPGLPPPIGQLAPIDGGCIGGCHYRLLGKNETGQCAGI